MKTPELTFENWFAIYTDHFRVHYEYKGPIDEDSAREDYNDGLEPENAADDLYDELMRPD